MLPILCSIKTYTITVLLKLRTDFIKDLIFETQERETSVIYRIRKRNQNQRTNI